MEIWKYIVTGRVQGVWYRKTLKDNVRQFLPNIKGYVRNVYDGSVEVVARGELEELQILERLCYEGSRSSIVKSVRVDKSAEIKSDLIGDTFKVLQF